MSGPGWIPWYRARQRAGGKWSGEQFRGAVDRLISEGLLIEAWLFRKRGIPPRHILRLAGLSDPWPATPIKLRGIQRVLEAESAYWAIPKPAEPKREPIITAGAADDD
jgi:hypothetical protein